VAWLHVFSRLPQNGIAPNKTLGSLHGRQLLPWDYVRVARHSAAMGSDRQWNSSSFSLLSGYLVQSKSTPI
jgi:hypothetical protein